MAKYSVKRPFTVVVAVIMILVLGVTSFLNMKTDLLPEMELPYVVVVTTYPGASPERVELAVTAPLEAGLGTVNGVKNVSSSSSENVSMVILEFENNTNMDSAMVNLSTSLDQIKGYLPDTAQSPMLLQISADMMPVMVASVDMEGMDIYELSEFVDESIVPSFERQNGVASVSGTGLVEQSVEIRLDEAKIEDINTRVLASVDDTLAEAQRELNKAKNEIANGKTELSNGKTELENQQNQLGDKLAEGTVQVDSAIAQVQAILAQETSLAASKAALEMERDALQQVVAQVDQMDGVLAELPWSTSLSVKAIASMKAEVFDEIKAAILATGLLDETQTATLEALTHESIVQLSQVMDRYDAVNQELSNIATQSMAVAAMKTQAEAGLKTAQDAYKELEKGKLSAAIGFGSGAAQMAAAESSLTSAETQMKDAQEQFDAAREEALKNADMSQILTKEMLANIIMAQNFSMPAGYIYQGDAQYLLRVGDAFASVEELENALLMNIEAGDIGDIRLSDVATITVIDNSADSYARVNGNVAVTLSVQKASTASTSEVSKAIGAQIETLEETYPGLTITPLMDQGDYIELTVNSVLSNLAWGAVLAILVLALFLKDLRPTIVVAFSIPISLMFAVVLMYFSGVTLNMISLSGLALGVGMLVDNSVVVMENIYRLRSQGVPAAKAAVQGANQVAGAIASSTLTTICVFLPIVFTEGITRQLFVDMALTIAYSLVASLIVALTLVPSLSASVMKTAEEKKHPWFDAMVRVYEKVLNFCLRFKVVPLAISIALLALACWQTARMGLEFMPSMSSTQMSAALSFPENTSQQDGYDMTDEVIAKLVEIEGVETVGAVGGGSSAMSMLGGGSGDSMTFYIVLEEDAVPKADDIAAEMQTAVADVEGCELEVSTSTMDLSALGGSGLSVTIWGRDLDTLNEISEDIVSMLNNVEGLQDATNSNDDGAEQLHIVLNKDAAMRHGLTVAQVYSELSGALVNEKVSTTLTVNNKDYEVVVVDDRNTLDRSNLMSYEFETTTKNENGETVTETHTLSEFASLQSGASVNAISRENQQRYMTVSATTQEGYNTSLVGRDVQKHLDAYNTPDGYTLELAGEIETINSAMGDLILMILLAVVFIYLIMVAQFQSLLSPFIVMFTIPLAFTGGLLALWLTGNSLSIIGMLGFLILAGVVVNNGIVFVDYTNQLRLEGMSKHDALIQTGKDRIRPILMTALTTILAMSTMMFSQEIGSEMMRPIAIVSIGGLTYSTILTLLVVPVLYDLLFRKELKKVDVGEED